MPSVTSPCAIDRLWLIAPAAVSDVTAGIMIIVAIGTITMPMLSKRRLHRDAKTPSGWLNITLSQKYCL
jgi:hypothetical protein